MCDAQLFVQAAVYKMAAIVRANRFRHANSWNYLNISQLSVRNVHGMNIHASPVWRRSGR